MSSSPITEQRHGCACLVVCAVPPRNSRSDLQRGRQKIFSNCQPQHRTVCKACLLADDELFWTLCLLSVGSVGSDGEKMTRMMRGNPSWGMNSSSQVLRRQASIQRGRSRRVCHAGPKAATMTASTTPQHSWRRPRGMRNKPYHWRPWPQTRISSNEKVGLGCEHGGGV